MRHNSYKICLVIVCSCLVIALALWLVGQPTVFAEQPELPNLRGTVPLAPLPSQTLLEISSTVRLTGTKRLGMNLGGHVPTGGSYLLKNLIRNPGFEAGEYSMILLIRAGATATRVQANWGQNGLAANQPAVFWDGAAYEILSGTVSLQHGTVITFTRENDIDTFYLPGNGPAPAEGNLMIVRQQLAGYCCSAQPAQQPAPLAAPGDSRPDSAGMQSLQLLAPTQLGVPSWRYQVDAYAQNLDPSAGKLLLADGSWHFAIWARAANRGDRLNIRLGRTLTSTFFNETIPLSTTWQYITRTFTVPVGIDPLITDGTPAGLMLDLRLALNSAPIWVDDIELARSE